MLDDDRRLRGGSRRPLPQVGGLPVECPLEGGRVRRHRLIEAWLSPRRMPACRRAIVTDHMEVVQLFCGVDSHKDTLAACLVDQTGRRLAAAASFPNTPAGHHELADLARTASGPVGPGRGGGCAPTSAPGWHGFLARRKAWTSARCPGALTVRERRRLRRPGKSDPTDALAIARITAREHRPATRPPRRAGRGPQGAQRLPRRARSPSAPAEGQPAARRPCDRVPRLCTTLPCPQADGPAGARTPRPSSSSRPGPATMRAQARPQRRILAAAASSTSELAALAVPSSPSWSRPPGPGWSTWSAIGPLLAARILGEVGDIQSRSRPATTSPPANGTAPDPRGLRAQRPASAEPGR